MTVVQTGWRLMDGIDAGAAMFIAWNALWAGALAVHNRDLTMTAGRTQSGIVWEIG